MGGLLEDGGEAKFARVVSTGDSRRVFVVVVAGCWYSDCGRVSRSWFTFSGCGIGPKICSMYDPTRSGTGCGCAQPHQNQSTETGKAQNTLARVASSICRSTL